MSVEGRLAYSWGRGERPPRIEAVVSAPEIDLDRAYGLLQGLFDGTRVRDGRARGCSRPRSTARRWPESRRGAPTSTCASMRTASTSSGLRSAISAVRRWRSRGNIDTRAQAPRGAMKLDLDARRLDGVAALLGAAFAASRRGTAPQRRLCRARQAHGLARSRSPGRRRRPSRTGASRSTATPAPCASPCRATSSRTAKT